MHGLLENQGRCSKYKILNILVQVKIREYLRWNIHIKNTGSSEWKVPIAQRDGRLYRLR